VIDDAMANVGARSLLSSLSMQTAVVAVTWLGRGRRSSRINLVQVFPDDLISRHALLIATAVRPTTPRKASDA
jgi:hypothetical protein